MAEHAGRGGFRLFRELLSSISSKRHRPRSGDDPPTSIEAGASDEAQVAAPARPAAGDELAVDLRDVSLDFDGKVVIERLSLQVAASEFICIIGKSGCGKTTLLRLMAGLLKPSGGGVYVAGRRVTSAGQDSAMVFQADTLYPWKKVLDNATFGLRSLGFPRQEASKRAYHWLGKVGLADSAHLRPRQLSGGMRQRVNLVRALAVQPTVLLMDEPFAALDYQTREELQSELIRICSETKMTVMFVTHDVSEAVYLADRIVVLDPETHAIRRILDIPWDRSRPTDLKLTGEFTERCRTLWAELRPTEEMGESHET